MATFIEAPETGFMVLGRMIEGEPPIRPLRFLVFAGSHYYPLGGWEDFRGSAATFDDAEAAAIAMKCDWHQVIDMETGQEVRSGQ
jgi:hypothetical protein